jgi:hypothetical protein
MGATFDYSSVIRSEPKARYWISLDIHSLALVSRTVASWGP